MWVEADLYSIQTPDVVMPLQFKQNWKNKAGTQWFNEIIMAYKSINNCVLVVQ